MRLFTIDETRGEKITLTVSLPRAHHSLSLSLFFIRVGTRTLSLVHQ